ncbi:hypothetical protein BGZ73_007231 [Actinomortierella ambigua]|nr:hypothetical protein BGZ73_007231 [Actinomortierella ambigua]
MPGESGQKNAFQGEDPSTVGMIVSTVITLLTLLGLLYCFRRASTLFPRGISIPLDNFMAGQRTRGHGPIALTDDDWRDADMLEDGLYVDEEGENFEYVDHPRGPLDTRGGSRPVLPFTTADTQRRGDEQGTGVDYEDDDNDDDACGLLGRQGGGMGDEEDGDDNSEEDLEEVADREEAVVYDIGSDDDDDDIADTAIRAPYKDDDEAKH